MKFRFCSQTLRCDKLRKLAIYRNRYNKPIFFVSMTQIGKIECVSVFVCAIFTFMWIFPIFG